MKEQEFTCTICPQGCRLKVNQGEGGLEISGFNCPRGKEYGLAEATNPLRTLTTTVKITGGTLPRLPVRTSKPIPKNLIFPAIGELEKITVAAPVNEGDCILADLLGTGADVIATRGIGKVKNN